jgi:hypothetical protein
MYSAVLAALLVSPAQPPAGHEGQNALFKSLLDAGVPIGTAKAKLPKPTMPDGLDGTKQTEIVKGLLGKDYDYAEFTRQAINAPQYLKIADVLPADPKAPGRTVDTWFVAYGDFKSLDDDKFLEKLTGSGKGVGGGKAVGLTPADLKKRNVPAPANPNAEGYGHVEFDFLDKVRLEATGHATWSRTADSVVVAAEVDPRFQDDKEFPNRWSPLTKASGELKAGPPNPWGGAATYIKVTKLREPAGAVFVEQHTVFAEPNGWFDGANLLRSKLPIAVQNAVRTFRTDFQKGK